MNMELIQNAATEVLIDLVLGIITLAGAYGIHYIRAGISKLNAQTAQITNIAARKLLENAVADVASLAMLSVSAMEQTTAKALRDAVKSGTKDREELLNLGKKVFDEIKAAIAPRTQEVISENLGNFDEYLTKCIEDAVLKIKQADPILTLPESVIIEEPFVSSKTTVTVPNGE